jgi:hypothetical protein
MGTLWALITTLLAPPELLLLLFLVLQLISVVSASGAALNLIHKGILDERLALALLEVLFLLAMLDGQHVVNDSEAEDFRADGNVVTQLRGQELEQHVHGLERKKILHERKASLSDLVF